jgi:hypothetical protein
MEEFGIQVDFNNRVEELMIFPIVEYDAGASFPPQQHTIYLAHQSALKEGRGATLPFLNFKIQI